MKYWNQSYRRHTYDDFIDLVSEGYEDTYIFQADATGNSSKAYPNLSRIYPDMLSQTKEDIMINEYIMLYKNGFTDSIRSR